MMEDPIVKTIVLNWNNGEDTLGCLESLGRQTYERNSVIVVDNNSTDGSPDRIAHAYPAVELIRLERNTGFAGGNNAGVAAAIESGAQAVLLLNNDTVAAPDLIEQMVRPLFSDESIAAVNPKIYYFDDPERIWSAGGMIDWRTGVAFQLHVDEPDHAQCDVPVNVDYAVGCALMTRADVISRIGVLDPDFFIYYEEAEWCSRARQAGYRIVYVPGARLWHKVSRSIAPGSPRALYYFSRNRLLFLRRSGAGRSAAIGAALSLARMAASYAVRGDRQRGRAVLKGVADSFLGRLGECPL